MHPSIALAFADELEKISSEQEHAARFKEKCRKGKDGCIEWTGANNSDGYPAMKWDGKVRLASHVAWRLQHGEFPKAADVLCHTCDNPSCVSVSHMKSGDQADNLRDMREKGRSRPGGVLQPKGA